MTGGEALKGAEGRMCQGGRRGKGVGKGGKRAVLQRSEGYDTEGGERVGQGPK